MSETANRGKRPSRRRTQQNQAVMSPPPPTTTAAAVPPRPPELLSILSPSDLAKLKRGYGPSGQNVFFAGARLMIPYGKAAALVNQTGANIYNEPKRDVNGAEIVDPTIARSSLLPGEREMVILTALALTQRDPATMAPHIYWALMEKMSVEKLADTFMTLGFYAGIDNLRFTTNLLLDVLKLLKTFADSDKTDPKQVLKLLKECYANGVEAKGRAALAALALPPGPSGNA